MPKYLVQASYVGDGVQGLRKEGGSTRPAVLEKACASVGGKLDAFYFAFGDTDRHHDHRPAGQRHRCRSCTPRGRERQGGRQDRPLVSPEEIDAAAKVGG